MKYPRYPKYKDSGVEWIGKIPEHWKTCRLKFVSKIQFSNVDKHSYDEEIPVKLANYIDVYKNEYITSDINFMDATATMQEITKFSVKVGDVLITKDSETPDDIAIPALVKSTIPNLICGYHLAQIRPKSDVIDGKFLFYIYSNKTFRGKYESEANGITRFGLSQYSFADTYICFPNLKEQRDISSFLESESLKIDSAKLRLKKMIELLKEKRQAIITNAVTKGLDPNVPMKDSGVEWIGKIPEHWNLSRIKFVSEVTMGQSPPSDFYLDRGNLPFLQGCAEFGEVFPNPKHYCEVATKTSRPGDILLSVRAPVGEINISNRVYGIGRGLCSMRPLTIKGDYLKWYLFAAKSKLISISNGSTYDAVAINEVKNLEIPISMAEFEQNTICEYLNTETTKIEILISKNLKLIDFLKEYKSSIITHAVTGKIDVRGFSAPTNSDSTET